MQDSRDLQRDLFATSLEEIGAEPLAGSGFETEEPETGSSITDLDREEKRPWRLQLPCPPNISTRTNRFFDTSVGT
jgi:hypothetical protein